MRMKTFQQFVSVTILIGTFLYIVLHLQLYNTSVPNMSQTFRNGVSDLNIRNGIDNEPPFHLLGENNWRQADREKFAYVFSAFSSDSDKSVVIIGVTLIDEKRKYYCQLWTRSRNKSGFIMYWTEAVIEILPGGSGLLYKSARFNCNYSTYQPIFVSLVTSRIESPLNFMKVNNSTVPLRYRHRFTVCSAPIRAQDDRIYKIIEWIELNRLLGAEKFIFYNYTTSGKLTDILNMYIKLGIVDMVQWDIPLTVHRTFIHKHSKRPQVHQCGQIASLHDCLLRCRHQSEFMVYLDLDEFIIPHATNTTTWSEMIQFINQSYEAFLFRSTMFRNDWVQSNRSFFVIPASIKLSTFQVIYREQHINAKYDRSKYITRTKGIDILRVHNIPNAKTFVFPTNKALLHHYRDTVIVQTEKRHYDATVPTKYGKLLNDRRLKTLHTDRTEDIFILTGLWSTEDNAHFVRTGDILIENITHYFNEDVRPINHKTIPSNERFFKASANPDKICTCSGGANFDTAQYR